MLQVSNLTKRYPSGTEALRDVSLAMGEGGLLDALA